MAGSGQCLDRPSDESFQLESLFPYSRTTTPANGSENTENLAFDQQTLENEHQIQQKRDANQDYCDDNEYDNLHGSARLGGISIQNVSGQLHASITAFNGNKNDERGSRRSPVYLNWILEIAMLVLSAGLLVTICLILDKYNDKEMPDWESTGITLNALIATLATIFRAILACIVFEILSQLKWDWISDRFRPMQEFQLFENASRGIYGSLCLLPIVALRQPLAIGAIIVVIFSLGIGPFVQQTIQPYQCLRSTQSPGQAATIRAVNKIDSGILERPYGTTQNGLYPRIGLKMAMADSIVNPSTDSNVPSLFTCTSGNCTFPTFSDRSKNVKDNVSHASVGVCSRCIDVYDYVQGPKLAKNEYREWVEFDIPVYHVLDKVKNQTLKITFGGIRYQNYMDLRSVGNLTWAGRVASDEFLNRARWSIANFTMLVASRDHCDRLPGGNFSCPTCKNGESDKMCDLTTIWTDGDAYQTSNPMDYIAAACILYPCINYYSGKVENGTLFERVVRDVPLRPQPLTPWEQFGHGNGRQPPQWRGIQQPCYVNGTIYTSSNISKADLGSNSTAQVQFHTDEWASQSPDSRPGYINITAPLECIYELPSGLVVAIEGELGRIFNRSCSVPGYAAALECGDQGSNYAAPAEGMMRNSSTSLATIRENVDSLAMRITTEIRKAGMGGYIGASPMVEGEVFEVRSCVRVEWKWLTLPVTMLALCAILLVWAILQHYHARDTTIWKSSLLPLLLRDHPGLEMMELKRVEYVAEGFQLKIEKHKKA